MFVFQFVSSCPSQILIQESQDEIRLMVVGMPNVGKSSLINALRRNYMKQGYNSVA